MLEDIFCGEDGVTKLLHDELGGTATITYVGNTTGVYNRQADSYAKEPDVVISVAMVPISLETDNVFVQNVIVEKNINFVADIAAYDLTRLPVIDKDKITYNGEIFTIAHYTKNQVGNGYDYITVYGKK